MDDYDITKLKAWSGVGVGVVDNPVKPPPYGRSLSLANGQVIRGISS